MAPAAENLQLTAELARAQAYIDRDERSALLGDVDGLRREVLRLQGTVERLSSAPQVGGCTIGNQRPDLPLHYDITWSRIGGAQLAGCRWPCPASSS